MKLVKLSMITALFLVMTVQVSFAAVGVQAKDSIPQGGIVCAELAAKLGGDIKQAKFTGPGPESGSGRIEDHQAAQKGEIAL